MDPSPQALRHAPVLHHALMHPASLAWKNRFAYTRRTLMGLRGTRRTCTPCTLVTFAPAPVSHMPADCIPPSEACRWVLRYTEPARAKRTLDVADAVTATAYHTKGKLLLLKHHATHSDRPTMSTNDPIMTYSRAMKKL